MTNILNQLADNPGARKGPTRVGRGIGSGKGKTCGRGVKGQKSRSGVAIKGFEGGQMPIHRRLPKRGFNNITRKEFEALNTGRLQQFIDENKIDAKKPINTEALIAAGLATGNKAGIKLLNKGEIKTKVTLEIDAASKTAILAIEKSGGKIVLPNIEVQAPKAKKAAK